MNNEIHTVLGAAGATGQAVIKELLIRNLKVNGVERSKRSVGIKTIQADLLNLNETIKAIQHSTFVYLCVGLPYQARVWTKDWPIIMHNVIAACERYNAKLIFFDNAYMYGPEPLSQPFSEMHLQYPTTKKGLARKQTTDMLLDAIAKKRICAVVGRSADFYGEHAVNSPFYISFIQNMLKGEAPKVLSDKRVSHTYAFTGDNGRALVQLALDNSAYGQVWHLPVGRAISFEEVNDIVNKILDTNFKLGYIPKAMRKFLSVFIPEIREVEEMLYQFQNPYEMNFDKFKQHFPDFQLTSYEDGLNRMVKSFKNS